MARSLVKNASNSNPRNLLINGALDFWQRGTSFSLLNSTAYAADRWNCFVNSGSSTGSTISRQTDVPSSNVASFSAKVTRVVADTNTSGLILAQPIELKNSQNLQNKTVTFSFWAKKGANYSPTSSALQVQIHTGTGSTDPGPAGSLTAQVTESANVTLTTSWQRFSLSATVGGTATQLRVVVRANHTGTAGADDSFYITGLMLTEGASAPASFYRAGNSLQSELTLCQRYYETFPVNTNDKIGSGAAASATVGTSIVSFKTEKRVAPTAVFFPSGSSPTGGWSFFSAAGTPFNIAASPTFTRATVHHAELSGTTSGMTANTPVWLGGAGSGRELGFESEL